MKVLCVIPARLDSKRFPGKVIYPLNGKPLLYYLHSELSKSKKIDKLVIATDNSEIKEVAEGFGAEVVRTSKKHKTGSDRAAEVCKKLGGDIILNIQADNFGLKAAHIDSLIEQFTVLKKINYATVVNRINSDDDLFDPNNVKAILDSDSNAITFSRFPIPYLRDYSENNRFSQFKFYYHIGIYLFRKKGLLQFADWKRTSLEKAESLEQLRIIENGEKIRVFKTKLRPISIDTKEDMKKIENVYR